MDTIIKSKPLVKGNSQVQYNPIISSNTVIPENQSSVKKYKEVYLRILNYLSEYKTELQKQTVRDNIDVYSKAEVDKIDKKVSDIRTDLGNREDSPNQEGNAFERINYLIEVISELTGDGESSIIGQIQDAINDLKGEVSTEYDTLKKIEDIIKPHLRDYNNPHQVTKEQVGLSNLTNDAQVKRSEMGQPGGVATLTSGGTIPADQLPSYVDDVIDCYAVFNKDEGGLLIDIQIYEVEDHSVLIIGEAGKIYADVETSYQFRWTGTKWAVVGAPTVIGTVEGTAFDGKRGQDLEIKTNQHIENTDNPHNVTYEQVGAIPKGGLKTINKQTLEGEGDINISSTANDVLFTNDLVITANVGVHTVGPTGSKTLPTTGKSIKQVMDLLFAEEKNPTITQPSVNLTSTSMGAKEVGTRLIPNYVASLNPGNYQYGPNTNVTAISWRITDTQGGTKDTNQGNFSELLVTDNTNYSITASAEHTDGAIPLTNLGNPYNQGRIQATNGTPKTKTLGNITGYRNSFYGTVSSKETITSNIIRSLSKSNKALTNGSTFNINIPIGALRVIIAYPSSLRNLTSVLDVNGLNANITSSFRELRLNVVGNNNYNSIEYKVYYLDYAEPYDTNNTYKVVI